MGNSVSAISEYAALATAAVLYWPSIEPLSDDEIEQRLLPKAATGEFATGSKRIQPRFTLIHRELRRKGVTLQLRWEEFVEAYAAARPTVDLSKLIGTSFAYCLGDSWAALGT